MTGRTDAQEAVLRSRGGRLLRGVTAAVAFMAPVVVLAFAVRQQVNPIITADTAVIRASTDFSRTHTLTSELVALQQVTQRSFCIRPAQSPWFGSGYPSD